MRHKVLEGRCDLNGDGAARTGRKKGKNVGFECGAVRLGNWNMVWARIWRKDVGCMYAILEVNTTSLTSSSVIESALCAL
jgi:hypothetical protein